MEWTWLKDWWRLKKLRRNNQLRHNNHFNNGDDVDDDTVNSGYEDEDFDDMCYCDECMNVRISSISVLYHFPFPIFFLHFWYVTFAVVYNYNNEMGR